MFTDYDALEKEKKIQRAMLEVRSKYVANACFYREEYIGRCYNVGAEHADWRPSRLIPVLRFTTDRNEGSEMRCYAHALGI